MDQVKEIEHRLKGKSYQELKKEMAELVTDTLLELLNGKSRKIGDTASSLLNQRNEEKRIAEAILKGHYTTKDGKVRAANTILFGKIEDKVSDDGLLYLARDKNEDSAGNALFALVALRRARVIPELEKMKEAPETSSEIKGKIELAIKALKAGDPKIYSPNYGG
jgi:HEAT repeat protein